MDLLPALLSNAVTATVLAAIVSLITRRFKRPPVVFGLWILVLVKLVTPPWWEVPILPHREPAEMRTTLIYTAEPPATPEEELASDGPLASSWPMTSSEEVLVPAFIEEVGQFPRVVETESAATPIWHWDFMIRLLMATWIAGSFAWLTLCLGRAVRFHRRLRHTPLAPPAIQERTQRLAAEFGLRRAPVVRVTRSVLPPILWPFGLRSTVVIPADLVSRLTAAQLETLLAHELAHLLRRDHWVRVLEALALAVYWWHPVVWWARRELQQAEEHCCDAWVLWRFPERSRTYAETLLETVEFLSEARPGLPPGASGFGKVNVLKRRFQMILREKLARRLSPRARFFVVALGLLALAFAPLAAQAEGGDQERIIIVKSNGESEEFIVEGKVGEKVRALVKKSVARTEAQTDDEDIVVIHDPKGKTIRKRIVAGNNVIFDLSDGTDTHDEDSDHDDDDHGHSKGAHSLHQHIHEILKQALGGAHEHGLHDLHRLLNDGNLLHTRLGAGMRVTFGPDGRVIKLEPTIDPEDERADEDFDFDFDFDFDLPEGIEKQIEEAVEKAMKQVHEIPELRFNLRHGTQGKAKGQHKGLPGSDHEVIIGPGLRLRAHTDNQGRFELDLNDLHRDLGDALKEIEVIQLGPLRARIHGGDHHQAIIIGPDGKPRELHKNHTIDLNEILKGTDVHEAIREAMKEVHEALEETREAHRSIQKEHKSKKEKKKATKTKSSPFIL